MPRMRGRKRYLTSVPPSMVPIDPRETVLRLARLLRNSDIPFLFTGGIVSSHYGEPRLTVDVDVVIGLSPRLEELAKLIERLKSDFIVDEEGVRLAWRVQRTCFKH